MYPNRLKKIIAVTAGVSVLGSMLAACGDAGAGDKGKDAASGEAGAKPFAGKRITAYLGNTGTTDIIKAQLPEFEAKTGMKVEIQNFANDQLSQKITVQMTSGSAEPDVAMIRPAQEVKLFNKNGWMQPLDEYVKKNPGFEFEDLTKAALDSTTDNGKVVAIPMVTEQAMFYYRKDLLEKAGLSVPKTLDELEAAVKKLHDPANGIYGFVARGQKAALVTQLSSFIYSEGGDFQKGDTAAVNTPEALKGINRYVNLLKNYGPPGVLNMDWPQALGVFSQGKAAFFTDTSSILPSVIDKDKSTVVDKIGYAMFPAGSAGSKPYNNTAWGMMMNARTANKDAAWAFIEWATGKEIMTKAQAMGVPGARNSIWNDPGANAKFPKEFIPIIQESIKAAVGHDRPMVINVGEARDMIGDVVVKGILNEDVKTAADKANKDFQALIDKEKSSK
ncbi:ABC transporter substrate-binding protein [Paenibacillus hamazuiensis]|uniref:ABC transporter substrate-binding protein n=1 Tax=Paenibacillus hamazuiensis TaxID=2936508 RepID=UPI00200F4E73|nr:sugar ABC transporter substrate-binding protein [Paenibacillus hamazuiensis]